MLKLKNWFVTNGIALALSALILFSFIDLPLFSGTRKVFVSDLWLTLWTLGYFISAKLSRRHWLFLGLSAGSILLLFFHGAMAPGSSESVHTNFWQGSIIALRLILWLGAGTAVYHHCLKISSSQHQKQLESLATVLAVCLSAESALIILEFAAPSTQSSLHHFFANNFLGNYWRFQTCGTFTSAFAAAYSLGLGLPILLSATTSYTRLHYLSLALTTLALFLTRTETALVAIVTALTLSYGLSIVKPGQAKSILAGSLGILTVGATLFFSTRNLEWKNAISAALVRIDLIFFGFGFVPGHTNSSYIWLFSRGGLALLSATLAGLWLVYRNYFKTWNLRQRSLFLYLLISSLTFETLSSRHTLTALIAVGVASLLIKTGQTHE